MHYEGKILPSLHRRVLNKQLLRKMGCEFCLSEKEKAPLWRETARAPRP